MPTDSSAAEYESPRLLEATTQAPEGQVWVCSACGKRARTRAGFDRSGKSTTIDHGYDSSCMTHAVLCYAKRQGEVYQVVVPS